MKLTHWRRKTTRSPLASYVLMNRLPGSLDAPCNFGLRDQVAFIDLQDSQPSLAHVVDCTQDGILQGRCRALELHEDSAVTHSNRCIIATRLKQVVLNFFGQLTGSIQHQ